MSEGANEREGVVERIIDASVRNRFFVLLFAAMVALGGVWAVRTTPVDAIPDLSDVQVIVYTDYAGQAPEVVEDQVTYPLATAMLSVPFARDVRAYSFFGVSMVYVIFEDGTDLYWARSRVLEALNVARGRLPASAAPQLGPDATGVGWVYEYTLTDFSPRAEQLRERFDASHDLRVSAEELPAPDIGQAYSAGALQALFTDRAPGAHTDGAHGSWAEESVFYLVRSFDRDRDGLITRAELERAANFRGISLDKLRSLQDWYLRYDLTAVKGVAEVASVGGFVRQYQVVLDPEKLRAYNVSLGQVKTAVQRANQEVGGRLIELAETEFMVRGEGYIRSIADLETVPVGMDAEHHVPILLRQLAHVQLGPEVRRGIVDRNGEGEVVAGVVVMRFGENARSTIRAVEARLAELELGLPEGVEVHVAYDRSQLIDRAVDTLTHKLAEELLVVALICVLFLLHLRSAFVAVFTVPIGVLMAFLLMRLLGMNANIMSLGGIAIAIGVMVDASVVMVENLHKVREHHPDEPHLEQVLRASKEVGPALFFSLLIVTVSFLPVFALEQQEGRMFRPLAFTKTFAMGSSSVLAITVIPALMYYLVRGKIRSERDNPLSRFFIWAYRPIIGWVVRPLGAVSVLVLGALLAGATVWPLGKLGSEFMPPLNEGDLLYMPTTPPGISITEARALLQQTDRLIAQHPQVRDVLGKVGRAETATDPAPLAMLETTILLTDPSTWPTVTEPAWWGGTRQREKTIEDVIRELNDSVQLPGVTNAWTMPIKTRIDMLATGIKTPVGIKLLGDDLEVLSQVGQQIEAVLRDLPGTASVYSERVVGGNYVDVRVRREDAARYGLNVADVQDVVAFAIGGMNVSTTVEGLERYPVNLRYPRELRDDLASLREVAVPTPMGHAVPLGQVADISVRKGPAAIKSENARRTAWIYVDLSTSDIGGYVERARAEVAKRVQLPPGVSPPVWSGQYEYMERASERLWVVGPLTIGLVFLLLYLHFGRVGETVMTMVATVVFAPIGGIWLLYLLDFNLSIASGVGFIALAGLAAETGVVMLVYLDQAYERAVAEGRMNSLADLEAAILEGAVERVRPKLMTVSTTMIGLLPALWGTGTGTRIMKRIAAPMVGGMVSSTVLTLVLLPAMYLLWKGAWLLWEQRRGRAAEDWTCPMHPDVHQDHPGDCPKCGMHLEKR